MSQWIAVEDEYPAPYVGVMVFMKLSSMQTGCFYDFAYNCPPVELSAGHWNSITALDDEGCNHPVRGEVTHWMPIPENPLVAEKTHD